MKVFLITLLILTLFANVHCAKNEEQQTHCDSSNTVYIPADARSRFFFKEGTFWVYKNSVSGVIDTLTVKYEGYEIGSVPKNIYGDGFTKCYEGYIYNIISKIYRKVNVQISVNLPTTGTNTKNEIFVSRELFTSESFLTSSLARFKWQGETIDSLSGGKIEFLSNLEVNNVSFNDILHYSYKNGFEESDYLSEAWYANKIGLIKIIRMDGTTWELINYKIIQ